MVMPSDLVTLDDVEKRFYRALTPDEQRVVPAWITDAWDELMDLGYLRLTARLAEPEAGLEERVGRVVRSSVLRRLLNPQGRRQYSYGVDDATVSETLGSETMPGAWFTEDELSKLAPPGSHGDAFTIRPARSPVRSPGVDPWISL